MTDVTMPQLGETVAEGTVTRWLRNIGDTVVAEEPLLEVSTDKVDTEVPAPASGVLAEIVVAEDMTVPVGTVIARIGAAASAASAKSPIEAPLTAAPTPVTPSPVGAPVVIASATRAPRHRHTPLIRRLAGEHGLDPDSVTGTGQGGRVSRADMLGAIAAVVSETPSASSVPITASSEERPVEASRPRTVVADRMLSGPPTSAHSTSVVEMDVTAVLRLVEKARAAERQASHDRLRYFAFVAIATAQALRAHPVLNASIAADGVTVTYHSFQHLAIAVDTPGGLILPVIRDAGDLTVTGLARRIPDVAERARAGNLAAHDLSGATFTLTNSGSRGVLFDTPTLTEPQVGSLAIGAVVERPVVTRDQHQGQAIAIRSIAYFALTYDRRHVDSADAAGFLATVRQLVENPDASELG